MKFVVLAVATSCASGAKMTQTTCFNEECTLSCQSHEFPLNQCLRAKGGLSAILACKEDVVEQQTYCGGSCDGDVAETKEIPQGVCVKGNQPGDYFKDSCLGETNRTGTSMVTEELFAQLMFNHVKPAANGTWSQKVCSGTGCTEEDQCEIETYNQGQCYPVESGGSAIGECWACGVRLSVWAADGCPGAPSQVMTEPVGECAKQQGGSWAINYCGSPSSSVVNSAAKIWLPPALTTATVPATTSMADAPTTTATTVAQSVQADFSQFVCKDRKCSTDCETDSYTFDDCLPVVGGGSARGVSCCDNTDCVLQGSDFGLLLDVFRSSDCSGPSSRMKEPVTECDRTSSGDQKFAKFVCGGNASSAAVAGPLMTKPHLQSTISV